MPLVERVITTECTKLKMHTQCLKVENLHRMLQYSSILKQKCRIHGLFMGSVIIIYYHGLLSYNLIPTCFKICSWIPETMFKYMSVNSASDIR